MMAAWKYRSKPLSTLTAFVEAMGDDSVKYAKFIWHFSIY